MQIPGARLDASAYGGCARYSETVGNMVKAVVNDVVTYYPGRHYNEEVDNSVSTVKRFCTMGSTTVAVCTVSGTEDVLNWVL
ncbi:MAG: hypothetical protein K8R77_05290, partial [Anaerolineaceae bacterium]|nr:hypothetical protein [Anaerolineaceae bacterium]